MIYLIVFVGLLSVVIGRWMFGRWFNHVAIYSAIWSITLALFETRFIRYYPLQTETWMIILAGWLVFFVGSSTVVLVRFATSSLSNEVQGQTSARELSSFGKETSLIRNWLWAMIIIGLVGALQLWYLQIQQFGSVSNVIVLGNIVYSQRVTEGIPGSIPYIDSFALTAAFFAGIYTAAVGKFKVVAFLPLVVTLIVSIAGMGRAKLLMGAILFVSAYFLSRPSFGSVSVKTFKTKLRRALALASVVLLLIVTAEIVRSSRGTIETFRGSTPVLRSLSTASFITPSVYLYLTVHYGVLNQYLLQEREGELWGGNTFAPMWRLLSKIGFDTDVSQYQRFYKTPVESNTGTYLRGIHEDFGFLGVLLYPYILGLVSTYLWFRVKRSGRYIDLALLAHIYVVVAMSFFVGATSLGYWLASLLGAVGISFLMDRRLRSRLRSAENNRDASVVRPPNED